MLRLKSEEVDHSTYSFNEERINAITHAIGFVLAIIGLIALTLKSQGFAEVLISVLYGASLAFMFLSSTVYHATSNIQRRAFLRQSDHTAIYLLIAGTCTPFLLLAVGGKIGLYGAIVVLAIGLGGIIFKLTLGHKYPKVGVATYAIMGWLAVFLIYPIYQALSGHGFVVLGAACHFFAIYYYVL